MEATKEDTTGLIVRPTLKNPGRRRSRQAVAWIRRWLKYFEANPDEIRVYPGIFKQLSKGARHRLMKSMLLGLEDPHEFVEWLNSNLRYMLRPFIQSLRYSDNEVLNGILLNDAILMKELAAVLPWKFGESVCAEIKKNPDKYVGVIFTLLEHLNNGKHQDTVQKLIDKQLWLIEWLQSYLSKNGINVTIAGEKVTFKPPLKGTTASMVRRALKSNEMSWTDKFKALATFDAHVVENVMRTMKGVKVDNLKVDNLWKKVLFSHSLDIIWLPLLKVLPLPKTFPGKVRDDRFAEALKVFLERGGEVNPEEILWKIADNSRTVRVRGFLRDKAGEYITSGVITELNRLKGLNLVQLYEHLDMMLSVFDSDKDKYKIYGYFAAQLRKERTFLGLITSLEKIPTGTLTFQYVCDALLRVVEKNRNVLVGHYERIFSLWNNDENFSKVINILIDEEKDKSKIIDIVDALLLTGKVPASSSLTSTILSHIRPEDVETCSPTSCIWGNFVDCYFNKMENSKVIYEILKHMLGDDEKLTGLIQRFSALDSGKQKILLPLIQASIKESKFDVQNSGTHQLFLLSTIKDLKSVEALEKPLKELLDFVRKFPVFKTLLFGVIMKTFKNNPQENDAARLIKTYAKDLEQGEQGRFKSWICEVFKLFNWRPGPVKNLLRTQKNKQQAIDVCLAKGLLHRDIVRFCFNHGTVEQKKEILERFSNKSDEEEKYSRNCAEAILEGLNELDWKTILALFKWVNKERFFKKVFKLVSGMTFEKMSNINKNIVLFKLVMDCLTIEQRNTVASLLRKDMVSLFRTIPKDNDGNESLDQVSDKTSDLLGIIKLDCMRQTKPQLETDEDVLCHFLLGKLNSLKVSTFSNFCQYRGLLEILFKVVLSKQVILKKGSSVYQDVSSMDELIKMIQLCPDRNTYSFLTKMVLEHKHKDQFNSTNAIDLFLYPDRLSVETAKLLMKHLPKGASLAIETVQRLWGSKTEKDEFMNTFKDKIEIFLF